MERNSTIDEEQTLAANAYEEDDVEMLDAETLDGGSGDRMVDRGQGGKNKRRRRNRKKNKAGNPSNIADINRFIF